jgi:hypothetical protein
MNPKPTHVLKSVLVVLLLCFSCGCETFKPSGPPVDTPDALRYPDETPEETAAWYYFGVAADITGTILSALK